MKSARGDRRSEMGGHWVGAVNQPPESARAGGHIVQRSAFSVQCSAFTLIEITLAIGIVAFALVAIFSLLPVAIDSSRESAKDTTLAAISERVVSDIRSRGFTYLANASATPAKPWPLYFDADGRPVTANTTTRAYRCDVLQIASGSTATNPAALVAATNFPTNRLDFYLELRWPAAAPYANQEVRRLPVTVAAYQ